MEEEQKKEPKISLVEALVVGPLFFAIPDLIELILIFFGLDDFWITDIYSLFTAQTYLYLKGIKPTYSLVANCLELIPYIGWLPMRTVGFAITFYIDHHPEKFGKAMRVAQKLSSEVKAQ